MYYVIFIFIVFVSVLLESTWGALGRARKGGRHIHVCVYIYIYSYICIHVINCTLYMYVYIYIYI